MTTSRFGTKIREYLLRGDLAEALLEACREMRGVEPETIRAVVYEMRREIDAERRATWEARRGNGRRARSARG